MSAATATRPVLRRTQDVIEDCEWMARWGESLTGAATRLGYRSRNVLERVLCRAGRPDLVAALKAAEVEAMRATAAANRRHLTTT